MIGSWELAGPEPQLQGIVMRINVMGISGGIKIAVGGATGNVGSEMLRLLERRGFPASEVIPLASAASGGRSINFRGEQISVRDLATFDFSGTDLLFLSTGATNSREISPKAAASGCIVIDNSSAFRMDPAVPLVVPEVNMQHLDRWQERQILPVANCSTIQLVVALKPVHDAARLACGGKGFGWTRREGGPVQCCSSYRCLPRRWENQRRVEDGGRNTEDSR